MFGTAITELGPKTINSVGLAGIECAPSGGGATGVPFGSAAVRTRPAHRCDSTSRQSRGGTV
jgi:hypothetical protein